MYFASFNLIKNSIVIAIKLISPPSILFINAMEPYIFRANSLSSNFGIQNAISIIKNDKNSYCDI